MSYIAALGDQSTSSEILTLTNLNNLGISSSTQFIRKIADNTFINAEFVSTVPVASATILGGIKVGERLTITNEVLSADIQTLSPATNTADYIPQWNGADSKTLKNGLPITTWLKLDQTTPQTIINGQPVQDTLTASELVATDANKKLQSLAVATYPSLTELSYVKGLSSAIQTQLGNKVETSVTVAGKALTSNVTIALDDLSDVVCITPDPDDVLTFDGANWVCRAGVIGAGNGIIEYLTDTDSPDVTDAKYLVLSRTPLTTVETSVTQAVTLATTGVEIKSFIMSSTGIGVTTIPAGVWEFDIWAKNSAGTTAGFQIEVYAATVSGGNVTLGSVLFTTANQTLTSSITAYEIASVQPAFTGLTASHRIVFVFKATQSIATSRDVTIYIGGSTHASHASTPLQTRHNDLSGLNDGDYKHLTAAQVSALHGVNDANTTSNSYADGKVEDSIVDGHTTVAPSGNAVFDALALKAPLSDTNTPPTDLKISTASKGGVFNGGFEIDDTKTDSGATSSYETTIVYKGSRSLKIAYTTTAADYVDLTDKWLIGNGKTYKVRFMGYASVAKSIKLNADGTSQTLGTFTIAANSWNVYEALFTASGDYTLARFLGNDTTASNIYIDQLQLEEVATDTTFTGKVAEKIRPVLQAVTSTDNIDQSQLTEATWTALNVNYLKLAQGFTPTKKYLTKVEVDLFKEAAYAATAENVTVTIETDNAGAPSGTILASKVLDVSSIPASGSGNYKFTIDVPCILTAGVLYYTVLSKADISAGGLDWRRNSSSSYANGTGLGYTSGSWTDLTADFYFNTFYAKKSENFTLIANGVKTDLKADKDGLLSNAIIDLDNGKYRYDSENLTTAAIDNAFANNVFAASSTANEDTAIKIISGFAENANGLASYSNGVNDYLTLKINTVLPIKSTEIIFGYRNGSSNVYRTAILQISSDNINWTTLETVTPAGAASVNTEVKINTDLVKGLSVFYLRWYGANAAALRYIILRRLAFNIDLDTSSIPQGLFYPLSTNQFTETIKLPSVATRAYFRLAKFQNEYGVVVPAIEFTDASGVNIGYIPLKLDNSQETNPAVAVVVASTTNAQNSGTGTLEGANYILNDGEYMTLSTAVDELSIVYLVGKGTTAFTNITKNTLYLSSNGDSNDATQDPSHQGNFIIGVRQQGLIDRVKDVGNEIADIKQGVLAMVNSSPKVGYDAGTTDAYEITIPNFTGYYAGMSVLFKANTVNTGASTLNINGMGAKAIVKGITTALSNADILALMWCQCVYDGVAFVLMNPRAL